MLDILSPISENLTTERTILKPFKLSNVLAFYDLIQDNKSRLMDSFPITLDNTINEKSTEHFIKNKISDWEERISFTFGIFIKPDEKLIGYMNIKNIDWVIPKAEIAYFISSIYEGKGLMKEALNASVKFCFDELSMMRLYLRVIEQNERSNILAQKCGFIKEGTSRKDHRTFDGRLVDLNYYGMTLDDYNRIKA